MDGRVWQLAKRLQWPPTVEVEVKKEAEKLEFGVAIEAINFVSLDLALGLSARPG